ncbi:MAG: HAD hydrolase family protein [Mesotoga sp.]|uniref:HAD hydrolase family protein n=1 Tax=Mesotoga sp. TaxID=2053577 RepID=UPI002632D4B6|nr:HAD hydrolase family protein [Mesotoga sp.]MDI9368990.1 HAD hydrolase family protein [Thermotogota bacterium]MDD2333267.1 HAD hydrolase family protein [Mesotoga sp.]MDD3681673.1 HAD hydrolase family protein [Mesotoga sp.]MDD4206338.1 HAD hydrolase family protein [Mesotoga sp.]MDD4824633.1 HAD hydrolase family protein [Mesotoga sp.]
MKKLRDRQINFQDLRALILDLDGTLLDDTKEISDFSLEAIEKLKKNEIKIAVFTGRDYLMAREYLNVLDLEGPHALQNGAFLIKGKGEIIAKRWVDGNISSFLLELAPTLGCDILARTDSQDVPDWFHECDFVINPYLPFLQSNEHRITMVDDLSEAIAKRKLLQLDITGDFEVLTRVLAEIKANFEGHFSYSLIRTSDDTGFLDVYWSRVESGGIRKEITSMVSNWGLLSIYDGSVSKGIAFNAFLDYHGLSSEEVAFIGDHYADIPLLQRVGLAVAVENAFPEVKAVCDYVTHSNTNDGVAYAINEVFFRKENEPRKL